jgi:hypothetical protein
MAEFQEKNQKNYEKIYFPQIPRQTPGERNLPNSQKRK